MTVDGFIELGVVVKPHGYKGSFVVRSDSGQDSALSYVKNIYVGTSLDELQEFSITQASCMPKGWKLTVEEVDSEERVEQLRKQKVFAKRADLKKLEQDEYYVEDLVGLEVWDSDASRKIGRLSGVEPANQSNVGSDRWWVESEKGQTLSIPANQRYVEEVNISAGKLRLRNLGELDYGAFS